MKKWMLLLMMTVLLVGCAAEDTFETVADEIMLPAMAQPRFICVDLPGETALPVVENQNGRVYVCNDYEIVLQTLERGDLERTVQVMSGLTPADLTMMETEAEGIRRYDFVWAAAGEAGDWTGRGAILDDGNYHYCLSVLSDTNSSEKSHVNWEDVFSSFCLS